MIHHLRAAGVSLLVDARGAGVPAILHWGRDLGDFTQGELVSLADTLVPAVPPSSIDVPFRLTIVPGLADGWSGRPAISVARQGPIDLAPTLRAIEPGERRLDVRLADASAEVSVVISYELTAEGVLRAQVAVRNEGADPLGVAAASVVVPVPDRARELLDFAGLWANERRPQRLVPGHGIWSRESRHGRPGHDHAFLTVAGTPGFGFRSGEVWAAHVAWSGDSAIWFERSPIGPAVLGGGELLGPGEVTLPAGEEYRSPWVVLVHADAGLDGVSARAHRWIRAAGRPRHPRPVVLNTWEAVYFDQSLERLEPLVDAAARVGVERFVLDDGWFRGRTDDRRALGDWFVDPEKWPQGLDPLIERVRAAGMDFGIWVEPEMVSPDSDLARAHPEWMLQPPGAPTWRWQSTLDLANPGAWAHVFERLDALLTAHPIAFVKWDHNRDLLRTDAHRQTLALYRLLDAVRRAHPDVEIESCASGGGRIDLGILPRVDRVWTSDTNDPLVRQRIQRYTGVLIPPEYLGGHLGAARAHTTGRTSSLSFRMVTALFGSAGIEWNLAEATPSELDEVAAWTAVFRREREFLHSATVVRADDGDASRLVHGVVDEGANRAIFAVVALDSAEAAVPPAARLPGLRPDVRYVVRPLAPGDRPRTIGDAMPPWWERGSAMLTGRVLEEVGLPVPLLAPEEAILLEVVAAGRPASSTL